MHVQLYHLDPCPPGCVKIVKKSRFSNRKIENFSATDPYRLFPNKILVRTAWIYGTRMEFRIFWPDTRINAGVYMKQILKYFFRYCNSNLQSNFRIVVLRCNRQCPWSRKIQEYVRQQCIKTGLGFIKKGQRPSCSCDLPLTDFAFVALFTSRGYDRRTADVSALQGNYPNIFFASRG